MLPASVKVVEVGPRDGLQNESISVPTAVKIAFIDALTKSGLQTIEVTSFVSPRWIPQLADAADVYQGINRRDDVSYPVLVPNERGMERALAAGVRDIAVFTAASETFNRHNINATISQSLERASRVTALAREHDISVRGYISCALGCPYEGEIDPAQVASVAAELRTIGCSEISLGDTIGAGTPVAARSLLELVSRDVPLDTLAIHFHDTRGQALANIYACLEAGVRTIDASVAGLGGCPYAKGASGNVATEDLVFMLHGMDIDTGIDIDRLVDAGLMISEVLERQPVSRIGQIKYRSE